MRFVLIVVVSFFMLAAVACGDDSDEPTPTSTTGVSTPTQSTGASPTAPSPTVVPGECPLPADQCAQVEQLSEWLSDDDVDAVVGATKTTVYTCPVSASDPRPLPLCEGAPAGEQRTGVAMARRYSEGAALSVDDYRVALHAFLDAVDPAASDAGGPGGLDLIAVSCVDPAESPADCSRSVAIFSAIIQRTTIPGWGIGGGREVLLFWMTAESARTNTPVEETWTGIVQAPEVETLTSSGGTLFDLGQVFVVN